MTHRTTPFANGTGSKGHYIGTLSVSITSVSGDYTFSNACSANNNSLTVPNQTQVWLTNDSSFDIQGGAQRAVGAASVTHSWTEANTAGWVLSGVDIQAVVTSTPTDEALTDNANSDNW